MSSAPTAIPASSPDPDALPSLPDPTLPDLALSLLAEQVRDPSLAPRDRRLAAVAILNYSARVHAPSARRGAQANTESAPSVPPTPAHRPRSEPPNPLPTPALPAIPSIPNLPAFSARNHASLAEMTAELATLEKSLGNLLTSALSRPNLCPRAAPDPRPAAIASAAGAASPVSARVSAPDE